MEKERKLGWYLVLSISLLITFVILSLVVYFTRYMVKNAENVDSNLISDRITLPTDWRGGGQRLSTE